MHKRIRVVENICHMCEHKYARTHMCELYCDSRTRGQALAAAHKHFMSEFKNKLGIKYFVPDPINGGNSNTGPQIKRILREVIENCQYF